MKCKSWYEGLLSGLNDVGGDLNLHTYLSPKHLQNDTFTRQVTYCREVKIFHELLKEGLNKC